MEGRRRTSQIAAGRHSLATLPPDSKKLERMTQHGHKQLNKVLYRHLLGVVSPYHPPSILPSRIGFGHLRPRVQERSSPLALVLSERPLCLLWTNLQFVLKPLSPCQSLSQHTSCTADFTSETTSTPFISTATLLAQEPTSMKLNFSA